MPSEYTTLEKSTDAKAFADSRFGKHYIKRLKLLQLKAREAAEDLNFTDSYRAHQSTRASTIGAEIEYFRIAQTIVEDKGMVAKLRAKLKPKEVQQKDV